MADILQCRVLNSEKLGSFRTLEGGVPIIMKRVCPGFQKERGQRNPNLPVSIKFPIFLTIYTSL